MESRSRIYLDNNATTALHPRARLAMAEVMDYGPLNPSSVHYWGRHARNLLTKSRRLVASLFSAPPSSILFTSGGTEALNWALLSLVSKGHVITSSLEHPAVFGWLERYAEQGGAVTFLQGGEWGAVTAEQVERALRPETELIALMAANNETGALTDLEAVAAVAQRAGVPFLVDGVAWLGKERFSLPQGVSAICVSGHKIHGPKGVGALVMRSSFRVAPLLIGGGQEYSLRGGTENLSGIVGFAKAIELLSEEGEEPIERMRALRDSLQEQLLKCCQPAFINGSAPCISNTLNIAFPGVDAESLLMVLDLEGIDVSHGSACASGSMEVSRVLRNMGLGLERAAGSLRISLSRMTTRQEIDRCAQVLTRAVHSQRQTLEVAR